MGQQVCAPWVAPDKLCCEGGGTTDDCVSGTVPLVYEWTDLELIMAASNLLYARTGYRFPGVCSFDVWPCVPGCHSDRHPCASCVSYNVIELPSDYPVVAITSITENGVPLAATDYRLERGNRVVRLDGLPWQRNTFGLPSADPNAVETIVSYDVGAAPPIEGSMAAAALACELKKSCNGNECALPANVTSFARRGVAVELTDLAEMLKSGATGIPIVDHFLAVYAAPRGWTTMSDPAAPMRGQRVVP
jgi:hypothetical protein